MSEELRIQFTFGLTSTKKLKWINGVFGLLTQLASLEGPVSKLDDFFPFQTEAGLVVRHDV